MGSSDPDPDPMGDPGEFPGSQSYALSGKIMLSAIVILLFVVVLMVSLHLYARWYLLRARRRYIRRRNRNRRNTTVFFVDPSAVSVTASAGAARGLDPSVLKSLPVFIFSAATHPDPIECAVCLSEFEEDESGRVLPNCNHTFHVDCIDMWFHSHSSCPLCRSLVDPVAGDEIPAPEEVVIAIPDDPVREHDPSSSSEFCDGCRGDSGGAGTSAAEERRVKPAEIEVPRRNPGEFEDESPAGHSFRSPMNRMLSFKRMLSRDRRTTTVPSPSAGAPATPGADTDIERGRERIVES